MTTTSDTWIITQESPSLPELRAADRGVDQALESVLSDNTRRVYGAQWWIFEGWCNEMGLQSLPDEPLTVARHLAARANSGASIATIATMRLATSAISKAHEWAKLESPCRDPGVRASLKGWGRRLSKPQRQSGALTWGDVQRWADGSGRVTVVRSKTDAEAAGAVMAITPAAMRALDAVRPAGAGGEVKVFGLSESQIARRVKVIAKAAGLAD